METDTKEVLSQLFGGKDVKVLNYWSSISGGFLLWWMDKENEHCVSMTHSIDGLDEATMETEQSTMTEFVETAEVALADNRPLIKADNPKMLEVGFIILGAKDGRTVRVATRLTNTRAADQDVRDRFDKVRERMFELQTAKVSASVNPIKRNISG